MKTLAIRLGIFSFWGGDGNVFNCKKDGCRCLWQKGHIYTYERENVCRGLSGC